MGVVSSSRRRAVDVMLMLCFLAAHIDCARTPARASENLELGAPIPRLFAPRLSVATDYAPCTVVTDTSALVPRSTCAAPSSAAPVAVLDRARRASEQLAHGPDVGALRATALVDLEWSADSGIALDRSISYLRMAAQLSARPANALADLSAAYLLRAERTQNVRDLLEATEAASLALVSDSINVTAAFNNALALEQLGLPMQARRAWHRYLSLDSTSPWARDARARQTVLRRRGQPTESRTTSPSADADLDAGRASTIAWTSMFGRWAAAERAHDSVTEARALDQVARVGAALSDEHGDQSVASAASAIRSAMSNARRRDALARAHYDYARAQELSADANYTAALRWAARADSDRPASPSLAARARLSLGAMLMYAGRMHQAERVLRELKRRVHAEDDPSLAGRVDWTLGTIFLRMGDYEQARAQYELAIPLLRKVSEHENIGAVQALAAEAAIRSGDYDRGYVYTIRAARTLDKWSSSLWRHNAFVLAAMAASADGLPNAAADFARESVSAADANGLAPYRAESRITAARFLADVADTAEAQATLASVPGLLDSLPTGSTRRWLRADLALVAVQIALPRRAPEAGGLDSAVATFESLHVPLKIIPSLLERADSRFAAGNVAGGRSDLHRAVALLSRERNRIEDAELRTAFLASVHRSFDREMLLDIAAGRTRAALSALEAGRAAIRPPSTNANPPPYPAVAHGDKDTILDYAIVGDTVFVWVLAADHVMLTRTRVPLERLQELTNRVRAQLALGRSASDARHALAELYDVLVRPVAAGFPSLGRGRVTIIADGELANVPFAALYDTARAEYLVEIHPIRYAASLEDATSPRQPDSENGATAIIADPAFDAKRAPTLGRLQGAVAEAKTIARDRAGAEILYGQLASAHNVLAAFRRAAIIHYAGHALFDATHPMQSMLALAPDAIVPDGMLTASAISQLRLTNHPLVVLSACETMHPGSGRSGDVSGLTRAFLEAGARGVVGSQWRANDRSTISLMADFYHALAHSHDAARALQAAQIASIHSQDPALRSPSTWAAFRYAGQ